MMAVTMSLVLLGTVAFVTDFGFAYVSKRQLQVAADAGALAAAAKYTTLDGTCATLEADSDTKDLAKADAEKIAEENRPGLTPLDFDVECNDHEQLVVQFSVKGTTPIGFGAVFGADPITTSRIAQATVSPSLSGKGVRPYALCSEAIPDPVLGSGVVRMGGPGSGHSGSDCAEAEAGGNWWFIDCPEDKTGTPDTVAYNLEHGCDDEITVVPDVEFDPDETTPAELSSQLTADCNDKSDYSESCLSGDTGNSSLKNSKVYEKWPGLLGQTINFPVFCSNPTCVDDTVNGTGTNATYPVYSIAAAVVCGFHIYDKISDSTANGDCSGNPYTTSDAAGDPKKDKGDVWLYLKFVKVQVAGDTAENDCALGDTCDGGRRRVLLTR
jgi:hypothetical protein